MTTTMGPPPPKTPSTTTTSSSSSESMGQPPSKNPSTVNTTSSVSMGPPPPKNLNPPEPEPEPEVKEAQLSPQESTGDANSSETSSSKAAAAASEESSDNIAERKQEQRSSSNVAVPYTIPSWGGAPCHRYSLEVLKDGSIIDQFNVNEKGAYMFGRVDLCDFVLEHPTISRFHAVLQFNSNGAAYLYDLGSTHGTFVNKSQVKKGVYVELHVGDVIRFGHSTRLYILQGPTELMPPEADLERIRNAKIQREMRDMEESLLRAKLEASLADGVSWGMREDAIEETEDEVVEITWQTYKGQLTEKQEKTREKVIKRLEKIAHMKKEIDAIRAKDIAQGGLTQGQQTQIARNEQRMSQIMEELENLEETLNESIRESIGARGGRMSRGKRKGAGEEDEEEYVSDDDEFYDRTMKPSKPKSGENQSIETADSLLDKRDSIIREMEDEKKLLFHENDNMVEENIVTEAGDALDAYMSAISSQIAIDKKEHIRKELSALQSELDRVLYLLKIADPTGEASKKREAKAGEPKATVSKNPASKIVKQFSSEPSQRREAESPSSGSSRRQPAVDVTPSSSKEPEEHNNVIDEPEEHNNVIDETDGKTPVYTIVKPQWLGAVEDKKNKEVIQETPVDLEENDQFVDYKNRNKILEKLDDKQVVEDQEIEKAAPGLIIRKRKQVEKSDVSEVKPSEQSIGTEMKAEDAVALLLRHSMGYQASDDEMSEGVPSGNQLGKDAKKSKKVLGPEKPSFLQSDYESWVPPEGQSGDGRTSLNDRYGY